MENLSTTCRDLWNAWRKEDPGSPLVQQATEAIKKYNKDDWEEMSLEATDIMERLSEISANYLNVEDAQAKKVFFDLIDHVQKWFFIPNKQYIEKMAFALSFDARYKSFFNKYEPNLAKYIMKLIDRYKNEI